MPIPADYQIIQKTVKYARIRVRVDGTVSVTIPNGFSLSDLETFIEKQQAWIQKHQARFKNKPQIELEDNQLLLFGDRYHYHHLSDRSKEISINHSDKTIHSPINLLEKSLQEYWYKSLAKKHLINRTQELARQFNFEYNKVYVRSQKTKYGSCSSLGNISLNWRLIKAPKFVIDYVIIHELTHTEFMNHGQGFWLMLKSLCPDYQLANNWLKNYGHNL